MLKPWSYHEKFNYKCQPSLQEDDEEELPWQVVGVGVAWQRDVLFLRAPLEKGVVACHGFGNRLPVTC